jgi:hypothetical protein
LLPEKKENLQKNLNISENNIVCVEATEVVSRVVKLASLEARFITRLINCSNKERETHDELFK